MAIKSVFKFPDPILKKVTDKIIAFDSSLKILTDDLINTLYSYDFCIGLAAPQIGTLKRIIVIDVSKARKPKPNNGLLVMINPVIVDQSNIKIVREGCLSIPEYTANVKRAMNIKVQFQNSEGNTTILETQELEAHAIQHEIDHLDGILFLDRITNPASDLFRRIKH